MHDSVEFHQILVAVRPTRAAVRMGRGEGWEHSALRVLEILSVTWGGARDIIVTSDNDGTSSEHLWAAVELYDPDIWASYVDSYRGFQMRDPEGYEKFLEAQAKQWQSTYGGELDQVRRQHHDLFMRHGPVTDPTEPAAFWERARSYLAPSWDREYGHPEIINADELPSGPLVDITQLSPLPQRLAVPQTDHLPLAARVLVASKWGALSPAARTQLEDRGVEIHDAVITESDLPRVVGSCWGGSLAPPIELLRAVAEALGHDPNEVEQPSVYLDLLDEHGPFAMTRVGLMDFARPIPMRNDWPLVIVVGDTADDFALALTLDRCMSPALWVPPSLLGPDTSQVLANALTFAPDRRDRDRAIHLTSCSLEHTALEDVASRLRQQLHSGQQRVNVSSPIALPQHRPLSLLDAELSGVLEDEVFTGDTTGRGIRARLPSGVQAAGPLHPLSWWNDVIRFDHQLPSRWPLNEQIVARSASWRSRARVTREGIAFHSHPLGFVAAGQRLDQIVDNPRLRFPDAKVVFEVLAKEAGLALAESAAGRYTARTIDLCGGLPSLIEDLQRPVVRRVLDAYQSEARSGVDPGNYIVDRRFLSLQDLQKAAGEAEGLIEFLDRSLHTGVLRRGLCLDCAHCDSFGWYDADDIGQDFRCWRCRTHTVIDSTVVKSGGDEPIWYYALAEVVYQARAHNLSVPVLALHQVAGNARSVLGMTDHKIWFPPADDAGDNGTDEAQIDEVEIDIWAIIDGRMIIGEAKASNRLASNARKRRQKAQRLRRAADALTADTVVMATAQADWPPGAIDAVEKAFAGSRCHIDWRVNVDPYLLGVPG